MEVLSDTLPVEPTASAQPWDQLRTYLMVHDAGSTRVLFIRPPEVVIGRAPSCGLVTGDASVSRTHARIALDGDRATVLDLGSHNGTRVNGERVTEPRGLIPGDVITLGNLTVVFQQEVPPQSRPIALDGVHWHGRLAEELERSRRYGRPLSVVLIELGEECRGGDEVAAVVAAHLRTLDAFFLDGDRLHVLLAEVGAEGVAVPVERLIRVLTKTAPRARAGFASAPADGIDPGALTAKAKAAAQMVLGTGMALGPATPALLVVGDKQVIASAPAIVEIFNILQRLAASDIPVLVCGETGAGKEIAATALHHWSQRRARKMLTVNCAALPETLIESELFGYERGAFSGADRPRAGLFEMANGGTLFLDEVGELSLPAQAKLLRAVESRRISRLGTTEERDIDVRLVAATNRPLDGEVRDGRFRRDLFYRLSAATITVPPLRERPQDLPLLARRFLDQACGLLGKPAPAIAPSAMRALAAHSWPGNVRELKNAMDYLAATITEASIEAAALPASIGHVERPAPAPQPITDPSGFKLDLYEEIRQLEQRRMAEALEAARGVQVKAAELLGMPMRTFAGKMRRYGLLRK